MAPAARCLVNDSFLPRTVVAPDASARSFHEALERYEPTPLRSLPALATELGLRSVRLKDESARLGLPSFKVLGASWALECALRERPEIRTVVAASAGNHGRAVAHEASRRGLGCRIYLPARSLRARREAIAAEGAEVVVVDGAYEDAVAVAATAGASPDTLELTDVGNAVTAHTVIDGYATLFAEIADEGAADVVIVPVGVGALAAAAARFGAAERALIVGVEPVSAACLTASLAGGQPVEVATPGTVMAGLDCARVSEAAWRSLREGIRGTVVVDDSEASAAMHELAALGLAIGDCGAAPLAALRTLATEPGCAGLREAVRLGPRSRVVLVATEGLTSGGDLLAD
ncbi:MAG TPA: pyridoxal-phosphate dependent enzyme [Gaiellaceae bacterium]